MVDLGDARSHSLSVEDVDQSNVFECIWYVVRLYNRPTIQAPPFNQTLLLNNSPAA